MKSPFPGMDPYLEKHWGDVHHRLVQYACDALQPRLPEDLRASVDERLVVESGDIHLRRIAPDVAILERETWALSASEPSSGGIAVAEPLIIEEIEVTEGFIEIRDDQGRLITAIEFLSPANKSRRDGEKKYLKKQTEVLEARASLVEIDLVRAGHYVLAAPEGKVPLAVRNDYLACITLPDLFTQFYEVYPLPLRRRLPALPIPLRKKEPRIPLDLQSLLDHAYSAGRYHTLDYSAPLGVPLSPEDAAWTETLVREAGLV